MWNSSSMGATSSQPAPGCRPWDQVGGDGTREAPSGLGVWAGTGWRVYAGDSAELPWAEGAAAWVAEVFGVALQGT